MKQQVWYVVGRKLINWPNGNITFSHFYYTANGRVSEYSVKAKDFLDEDKANQALARMRDKYPNIDWENTTFNENR